MIIQLDKCWLYQGRGGGSGERVLFGEKNKPFSLSSWQNG